METKYACNVGNRPEVTWLWCSDESRGFKFLLIESVVLLKTDIVSILRAHCYNHYKHIKSLFWLRLQAYSVHFIKIIATLCDQFVYDLPSTVAIIFGSQLPQSSELKITPTRWLPSTKLFEGTPPWISRGIRWCSKIFLGEIFERSLWPEMTNIGDFTGSY